jgi:nucleoside-diphosphate-sugar epimerase
VLVLYLRARLRVWPESTISLVDIDDCAAGHLLAGTRGRAGERYVLNGATLDTDELAAAMREVAPSIRPPRRLPAPLAALGVNVVEALAGARGKGAARLPRRPANAAARPPLRRVESRARPGSVLPPGGGDPATHRQVARRPGPRPGRGAAG